MKPRWEDSPGALEWAEHSRHGAWLKEYQERRSRLKGDEVPRKAKKEAK